VIFVNTHGDAIRKNGGYGIHVWLKKHVTPKHPARETKVFVSSHPAMCGAELDDLPFPGGVEPQLKPANEATWAEEVMDLLGDNRMCEECRTRLAVYHGLTDQVTLWASSAVETDRCGECEVSAAYHIEGVHGGGEESRGRVVRQAYCPECGRDITRDGVRIPEDVEASR